MPPPTWILLVVQVLLLDLALERIVVGFLAGLLLLDRAARGGAEAAGADGEGEARDELLDVRAAAGRARGLLRGAHERFERGAARAAAEVEQGHGPMVLARAAVSPFLLHASWSPPSSVVASPSKLDGEGTERWATRSGVTRTRRRF